MDVPRALAQIAEIHSALAKADVYRGYRSVPLAASGVVGLGAAWLQPELAASDPRVFVRYWVSVAIVATGIGASEIIYNYVVNDDEVGRRRTRQVVGQFLPGLVTGAVVTYCLLHLDSRLVALLPGLWAMCFGLGAFASRMFLPRGATWVALYFCTAGGVLLWTSAAPSALAGWHVGATFGFGLLLSAIVLYWQIERPDIERIRRDTEMAREERS